MCICGFSELGIALFKGRLKGLMGCVSSMITELMCYSSSLRIMGKYWTEPWGFLGEAHSVCLELCYVTTVFGSRVHKMNICLLVIVKMLIFFAYEKIFDLSL